MVGPGAAIALLIFSFIQVPFLIIGCLVWHWILIKKGKVLSFYKLQLATLIIGIPLHIAAYLYYLKSELFPSLLHSYLPSSVHPYLPLVYFTIVVILPIYTAYSLGKIKSFKTLDKVIDFINGETS